MTNSAILKSNNFKTKRIETSNYKGVFGGTSNHVIALMNAADETLHFEGAPYYPCGRVQAYVALINSGDITAPCFSFKKVN
jgi:hypothetical protein